MPALAATIATTGLSEGVSTKDRRWATTVIVRGGGGAGVPPEAAGSRRGEAGFRAETAAAPYVSGEGAAAAAWVLAAG